jgi:hypothetical protein
VLAETAENLPKHVLKRISDGKDGGNRQAILSEKWLKMAHPGKRAFLRPFL